VPREHPQNDGATSLGSRVRALRRERNLTLKALGHRAGLSHPFLSQLERGLARPSVRSVERIAGALQVPVGALWTVPRRGEAKLIRADDGHVIAHTDSSAPGGIRALSRDGEPIHVREWSGGGRDWPDEAETTTGSVLVYVIRGALELDLDGTVHALAERDALLFDGPIPHRLRRTGPKSTRALYIATG
jgi:transcriptional regulator with XRE-family HTH domain